MIQIMQKHKHNMKIHKATPHHDQDQAIPKPNRALNLRSGRRIQQTNIQQFD